jgi:hypothetical protein
MHPSLIIALARVREAEIDQRARTRAGSTGARWRPRRVESHEYAIPIVRELPRPDGEDGLETLW